MRKLFCAVCVCFFAVSFCPAQGIMTAADFFKNVSDFYAGINDYEADVEIETAGNLMSGHVSFKRPEMLRIDFSQPAEQVILFNGTDLTIYLPGSSAILEQSVESSGVSVTPQGLSLLRRYYSVAYESGQGAVPLEEGSDEMVIKLLLTRRASSEAFSSIRISVDASDNLIRRVQAVTPKNERFTFDFYNYRLNTNIADQRFIYDPPSSANNYNNFLFSE